MKIPRPAKIYTGSNRNGTLTYRVNIGKDETGEKITHGFQSKEEAEAFKEKHDEALGLSVEAPLPVQDVPRAVTEAKIYNVRNPSGTITYRVDFQDGHGKRVTRGFKDKGKAEQFGRLINEKLVAGKKADLIDLAGVHRHEILPAIEKLKIFGATISEAVDFYLKFAKPIQGDVAVQKGITLFLAEKRKVGRSAKYLRNCEAVYFAPFQRKAASGCMIIEAPACLPLVASREMQKTDRDLSPVPNLPDFQSKQFNDPQARSYSQYN